MGFLRPKSRGKDAEVEQKKRNRLSKPLTNKSTTNLRAAAKQQSETLETPKTQSQLALESPVTSPVQEESRDRIRSHLFDLDGRTTALNSKTNTHQVKSGVAQLVAQYETGPRNASSSQLSLNSQVKKRPMSAAVYSAGSHMSQQTSQIHLAAGMSDYRSSPRSSDSPIEDQMWNQLQDRYNIPTRRKSTFTPGEATRKPSETHRSPMSPTGEPDRFDETEEKVRVEDKDDDNISETWTAPVYPDDERPDTPKSFEHKALGNLSLGSLHITNGRASPNFSEISAQPRSHIGSSKLRDVSSEYADSEVWEDEAIPEEESDTASAGRITPTNDLQRNFSFTQGAEERLTAGDQTITPEPVENSPPRTPIQKSPRAASMLAEEYMAELPPSPFATAVERSSPASTGSVVHHILSSDSNDQMHDQYNGPHGRSPVQKRVISNESHASSAAYQPSSAGSHLSSTDSQFAREEAFQSALEFQHFNAGPPSPLRPQAPFMTKEFAQSDSGYSSLDSVRSMQATEEMATNTTVETGVVQSEVSPTKDNTPRKLGGFLPLRPVIKSRNTAPAAPIACERESGSRQSFNSAPLVTDTNAESPGRTKESEKDIAKQRKKLQKTKPPGKFSMKPPQAPEEVIVQRNPSVETYSVPSVPPVTAASLNTRVQKLPELERTVQNHNKSSSSTSTLAVPQDIRFPSPNPEPDDDYERPSRKSKDRSKSRTRSKSRRRSMLEFFRGSKDDKRKSNVSQAEPDINIDDLGDVVAALGTNPYDIAIPPTKTPSWSRTGSANYDSRIRPRSIEGRQHARDITPHRLSYSSHGQRFMMDDHTASEYARNRSRSIHERDNWNDQPTESYPPNAYRNSARRPPFNDRGGIPGKNLRSPRHSGEAPPPMPPMPSPAEIRRLSGRYDDYQPPLANPESAYEEEEHSHEQDTFPSSPPPPPPHSPRPEFLDHEAIDLEDSEDLSLAPPPPCHSPRPMDIEPEVTEMSEAGWADQARAWRARRQSVGETLRANQLPTIPHQEDSCNWEEDEAHSGFRQRPRTDYFDGSENWPSSDHYGQDWEPKRQQNFQSRHDMHEWAGDSYYEADHVHPDYDYHEQDYGYYEDTSNVQPSQQSSYYNSVQQHEEFYHPSSIRREPSPAPSRPLPSRPGSRISYLSNNSAISLADELHPEISKRPSPAPSFGRYSGGLQFSYEGKNKGFGGSSGTRSVSGKADAQWKGMALKQTFGVDLGDVPIMGVVKPLR